jgi:hypothetical protein
LRSQIGSHTSTKTPRESLIGSDCIKPDQTLRLLVETKPNQTEGSVRFGSVWCNHWTGGCDVDTMVVYSMSVSKDSVLGHAESENPVDIEIVDTQSGYKLGIIRLSLCLNLKILGD